MHRVSSPKGREEGVARQKLLLDVWHCTKRNFNNRRRTRTGQYTSRTLDAAAQVTRAGAADPLGTWS
jgi:hypothetical protein